MKLYIYANFNKKASFFSSPICELITPEDMVKDYKQVICGLDDKTLLNLRECDLYCLGTYDNVTGEIVAEKSYLLTCSEVIDQLTSKESVDNGEAS